MQSCSFWMREAFNRRVAGVLLAFVSDTRGDSEPIPDRDDRSMIVPRSMISTLTERAANRDLLLAEIVAKVLERQRNTAENVQTSKRHHVLRDRA